MATKSYEIASITSAKRLWKNIRMFNMPLGSFWLRLLPNWDHRDPQKPWHLNQHWPQSFCKCFLRVSGLSPYDWDKAQSIRGRIMSFILNDFQLMTVCFILTFLTSFMATTSNFDPCHWSHHHHQRHAWYCKKRTKTRFSTSYGQQKYIDFLFGNLSNKTKFYKFDGMIGSF